MNLQEKMLQDRRDLCYRYMSSAIDQAKYWVNRLIEAEQDLQAHRKNTQPSEVVILEV